MAIKILGVDFRENAVSAVLIRGSYKGTWLEAHGHVVLDQPEDLEKGLKSCLETVSGQADISNAVCIAAIPSDRFFFSKYLFAVYGSTENRSNAALCTRAESAGSRR